MAARSDLMSGVAAEDLLGPPCAVSPGVLCSFPRREAGLPHRHLRGAACRRLPPARGGAVVDNRICLLEASERLMGLPAGSPLGGTAGWAASALCIESGERSLIERHLRAARASCPVVRAMNMRV